MVAFLYSCGILKYMDMKKDLKFKTPLLQYPVVRLLLVCTASVLMALNLNTFVHAGGLYPGGFTGLTLLIQEICRRYLSVELPFTVVNVLLNSVPVIISFKYIGRRFTWYSCIMILLSGLLTDFLPGFRVTEDVLLVSVFGGLLNACAISLCLFAGATSGGTDFIAIFISQKYGKDAWNYILFFNICILSAAGILFGWDKALYSIIFQFTSTQLLQVLYRRYQKVTLIIVTDNPDVVYQIIRNETHHDATQLEGMGCYQRTTRAVLYSVISGDEARRVSVKVKAADPSAFINVLKSEKIRGRFYSRPND